MKPEAMPIYSTEEIIKIKNGKVGIVLQHNGKSRQESKRKFYRNSNKPLGDEQVVQEEYYSKRGQSTISELSGELVERGRLDVPLERKLKENFDTMKIEEENSMMRSEEDCGYIEERDEESV